MCITYVPKIYTNFIYINIIGYYDLLVYFKNTVPYNLRTCIENWSQLTYELKRLFQLELKDNLVISKYEPSWNMEVLVTEINELPLKGIIYVRKGMHLLFDKFE